MQIAGFLKTSLIEWSGKITSVIFAPGCNFRCPFCHNADLIDPEKIKKIPLFSEKAILTDLEGRKKWIDAVVVTGGEPTLQKDLPQFLSALRKMDFLTLVHTNGANPEAVENLIKKKLVDFWAMDIKGDFENYSQFAGVAVEIDKIKRTLRLISKSGLGFELRTTVVPGLHSLENLTKLAKELRTLTLSPRWALQQFRPLNCFDKKYLNLKPFSKEEMDHFQKELQKIIPTVFLRGI